MPLKILADECTFDITVEFLRRHGYPVITVKELGLAGAKDHVVFAKAQELGAVLLTRDQEFGDIRRFPPSSHLGVIVLKMKYQEAASVHSALHKLLQTVPENQLSGTLFVVDKNKWRKRRGP
jgi:predicted nuclease of predicted toxin-antitoxin system